jgi:hypothetical protein
MILWATFRAFGSVPLAIVWIAYLIAVCAPHTEMEVIGLGRVVIGLTTTRP